MLWAAFALMTLVAAGALLLPIVRARRVAASRAAYDLEIYRDQLAEIERDQARGLIAGAEAKAARTEIARRALAADAAVKRETGMIEKDGRETPKPPRRRTPVLGLLAAGAAPLAALAIYFAIGSPGLPGHAFMAAHVADGSREDAALIARLEERLKAHPEDAEGWALLARSYGTLGRFEDAAKAWREAIKRAADPTLLAGSFGEALVQASDGTVTPEAAAQFETARRVDPLDPRPRYYLGLAKAQAGESRDALQIWTDLAAISPPNAPWVPLVHQQIATLAAQAKIDPTMLAPSAEAAQLARSLQASAPTPGANPGPNAGDVAAMEKLSPEERQARIRSMVDQLAARLESNPDDVDGWLRLGRARHVLGDEDKAVEAYARAAALAPDKLDVQAAYADAMFGQLPKQGKLPAEFVTVMRHILELDPNYGDALWFVGMAEADSGNRQAAIALWQRLIDKLPAEGKERAQIQAQIDRLKQATN